MATVEAVHGALFVCYITRAEFEAIRRPLSAYLEAKELPSAEPSRRRRRPKRSKRELMDVI